MKLNQERAKALSKTYQAVMLGVLLAVALAFAAWPWGAMIDLAAKHGWRLATFLTWEKVMEGRYLPMAWSDVKPWRTYEWFMVLWRWGAAWVAKPTGMPPLHLVGFPAGAVLTAALWRIWVDPADYRRTSHGKARKATFGDLRRRQLFDKTGFILARFKGQWVRNWETLSAILVAPPGTGKTVQLITNILADWPDHVTRPIRILQGALLVYIGGKATIWMLVAEAPIAALVLAAITVAGAWWCWRGLHGRAAVPCPSMVINDVKGEIRDATEGWRSQLGPTFTLAWMESEGDCFNMLDIENFSGGDQILATRRRLRARMETLFGEFSAPDPNEPDLPFGFHSLADMAVPGLLRLFRDGGPEWWEMLVEDPTILDVPLAAPKDARIAEPPETAPEADRVQWANAEKARWDAMAEDAKSAWVKSELQRWNKSKLDGFTLVQDVVAYQTLLSNIQTVIDRQMAIWITDSVESHWRNTGRAAGVGLTLFHIEQCLRINRTPSYGGLLDWMNEVTVNGLGFRGMRVEVEEVGVRDANGVPEYKTVVQEMSFKSPKKTPVEEMEPTDVEVDKTALFLEAAIAEAREFGYSDRVVSELTELVRKPDKERGSVISTFGSSIAIFKNPNVRARTSRSSFRVKDLRGWGKDKVPMTVYIVIKMEDAPALGPVTAAFVDMVANTFLSEKSRQVKKGRPIQFYLDEFWSLPPMKSTMTVVTLGRGQWLQEYLVGQSFSQLGMQMTGPSGAAVVDVMKDAMAYSLVPTQASFKTAKEISETIGDATVENVTTPAGGGLFKGLPGLFQGGGTRSYTGMPLYSAQDILNFPKMDPKKGEKGVQLALIYGQKALPIEGEPPCWFKDPVLVRRGNSAEKTHYEIKKWDDKMAA